MNKKYFSFDIDGTLTDRKKGQIVPSALEAVKKLQMAGHFVSIATGRVCYKAEKLRKENGFSHMVCNGGHGIIYEGELKENRPLDYKDAKAVYDQAKTIYKMYVSISKEEEHLLTAKERVGHLRFEEEYLMFQPDAKKEGILRMLSYAGGTAEDVVVFGDDYNDLVMFDDRFFQVAMGNGCDALKEKADFVADQNINDGIYKTCARFGWFD